MLISSFIVSINASVLIGLTIPLVPMIDIPPSIPICGLKVFFATSSPSGADISTVTPILMQCSYKSLVSASFIIFLGTLLIAYSPIF